MKVSGIIKIIIGAILVVVLTACLLGLMVGHAVWRGLGLGNYVRNVVQTEVLDRSVHRWEDNELGTAVTESASYPAVGIDQIDIGWIRGSVVISSSQGDDVIVSESSYGVLSEAQKMRVSLRDGRLKIAFCDDFRNVWRQFGLGSIRLPSKTLYVEIPESLINSFQDVVIETVSADVRMDPLCAEKTRLSSVSGDIRVTGLDGNRVTVSTTSGRVSAEGCRGAALSVSTVSGEVWVNASVYDDLQIETVSGGISVEGNYERIWAKSVSASTQITCINVPREITSDSISGSIHVFLQDSADFTAQLSTVSGKLSSEIPGIMEKNHFTCGSGSNRYRFETVSGSVSIRIRN